MPFYAERDKDGAIKSIFYLEYSEKDSITKNLNISEISIESPEAKSFAAKNSPPETLEQKIAKVGFTSNITIQALTAVIMAINNKETIPDWALASLNEFNTKIKEVVALDTQEKAAKN